MIFFVLRVIRTLSTFRLMEEKDLFTPRRHQKGNIFVLIQTKRILLKNWMSDQQENQQDVSFCKKEVDKPLFSWQNLFLQYNEGIV